MANFDCTFNCRVNNGCCLYAYDTVPISNIISSSNESFSMHGGLYVFEHPRIYFSRFRKFEFSCIFFATDFYELRLNSRRVFINPLFRKRGIE